jgi:hypothetical protein
MPEIYGYELQLWSARRVFSKIQRDLPREYTDRRLRTKEVAILLSRDTSTIRSLSKAGIIKHGIDKIGRTYSIKDLSDYIADYSPRKYKAKKHGKWSRQELKALVDNGYCKTRSKLANKTMRSRINNGYCPG